MNRFESIASNGVTWVDIEDPTQSDIDILARDYPFHPLNLEDCLSKRQLTKMDQHEDYLFVLLHFPVSVADKGDVRFSQVSMFLGRNYLVTLHQGDLKSLSDIFQTCKCNDNHAQTIIKNSSSFLLYCIIDRIIDHLFPIMDKLLSDLDYIEDKVFDEKISAMREVNLLRREINDFRRIIYPLRKLIADLSVKIERFGGHETSAYFSDVKDHIEKAWDILEGTKETVEIFKDTNYILTTEKANQILAVLTIIFTLTIPIVTLGTVYGMNINIPGSINAEPWTFLGTYTTFWIVLIVSAAPTLMMTWYFRRQGWL
ncbi:MAG TPA: magnesium transporter CorA family protein [Nitrososphaerales archaeon]